VSSPIADVFTRLQAAEQMAFMPFITAGDPDLEFTCETIRKLGSAGVDLIEIGFPYSDPIADGPVIQASYTRALDSKVSVSRIFGALKSLKDEELPPRIAMVSFAIIYRTGIDNFLKHCVDSGVAGLIVPDLPGAEAAELFAAVQSHGLDLIQLIAPTTPRERVREILKSCSGFVYCIAVSGITGEREAVANALLDQLKWLRKETDLPLAVGFGISKPEHVDPLRGLAEGVIVGSAIVREFEPLAADTTQREAVLETINTLSMAMTTAAHNH